MSLLPSALSPDELGKFTVANRSAVRPKKSGYLPGLDGLRALAILGVLLTHDQPWTIRGHSDADFKGFGGYGVYLFFAISGFLICTRILEEERASGRFHVKAFYIRRFFRIQPASWCYLAVIAVMMVTGICHESWQHWCGAFFQYQNFLYSVSDTSATSAFTGHFWTLSVEEHFYILLSIILYFFRKNRLLILSALTISIWLIQNYAERHGLYSADVSERRTYWAIAYLLAPATLALVVRFPLVKDFIVRYFPPSVATSATVVLMLLRRAHLIGISHMFSTLIIAEQGQVLFFGFSLIVIATVMHPRSWTTRFLELSPLRFIGRLSYSIYIWHVLFFIIVYNGVNVTWAPLVFLSQRPYRYFATAICALLSYYMIEKPLIRYGHKLAPPVTPGHRDLDATRTDRGATVTA